MRNYVLWWLASWHLLCYYCIRGSVLSSHLVVLLATHKLCRCPVTRKFLRILPLLNNRLELMLPGLPALLWNRGLVTPGWGTLRGFLEFSGMIIKFFEEKRFPLSTQQNHLTSIPFRDVSGLSNVTPNKRENDPWKDCDDFTGEFWNTV